MRQLKLKGLVWHGRNADCNNGTEAKRQAPIAVLFLAVGLGLVLPHDARAAMVGAYDLSLWTLTNTSADGFAIPTTLGVDITGGNTGSTKPGTTDLTILAAGTGLVSFAFFYFSLDLPTLDYAGYLLGPNFFPLADTSGTSGNPSFSVLQGQSFGFRVGTADNQWEPGILSISYFNAPASPTGTNAPEPATAAVVLAALALAVGVRLRQLRIGRQWKKQWKNPISLGSMRLAIIGIGLAASSSLFAQLHFTGSPVTGRLVLIGQVNVLQQAQQVQHLQIAVSQTLSSNGQGPEIKPNVPHVLLKPPAKTTTFLQTGLLSLSNNPLMTPMAISPITSAFHFNGITHYDQRNANHGNQFSVEPPSQGLAVANGFILEAVNNAFQVYDLSGVPQLPAVLSTNQVFGLAPAIDRNTGINGPFPAAIPAFRSATPFRSTTCRGFPNFRRYCRRTRYLAWRRQLTAIPVSTARSRPTSRHSGTRTSAAGSSCSGWQQTMPRATHCPSRRFTSRSARPTTPRERTTSTRWTPRMPRIQAALASRIIPRLEPINMDSTSALTNSTFTNNTSTSPFWRSRRRRWRWG